MELDGIYLVEYRSTGAFWSLHILCRYVFLGRTTSNSRIHIYGNNMYVVLFPPDTGEVFVAKQCDHCGKILPGDSIRYCPGCGKIVASSRPVKRSLSEDPPAWMKQLESSLT